LATTPADGPLPMAPRAASTDVVLDIACGTYTVDGAMVEHHMDMERCTFTTRAAFRGSKLGDQIDRNILRA